MVPMNKQTHGDQVYQFTVEQLQLQGLVESGLVPAWRKDFALSIATQKNPSAKQHDWVVKIVNEVLSAPAPQARAAADYTNIFNMFTTAKKHLKYPKVTLIFNSRHDKIKFGVQGDTSRRPGAISIVVDGVGYCGCIALDHELILTREGRTVENELVTLITEFNKAPAKMAAEHGKMLSACCFCRLPLKTQESLAVGYGPDCASHFGMPWGKQRITDPQILEIDLRTK